MLTVNLLVFFSDNSIHMLQGDVVYDSSDVKVPVMGRPPISEADITLDSWLHEITQSTKGVFVMLREESVLEHALHVLSEATFQQPVWLGAEMIRGPNFNSTVPVDTTLFYASIQSGFPKASIVLGWSTGHRSDLSDTNQYTPEMITEMSQYAKQFKQPIIFHVRLIYAKTSWDYLVQLLDESRAYNMIMFSEEADDVNMEDIEFIRQNSEHGRIFYKILGI